MRTRQRKNIIMKKPFARPNQSISAIALTACWLNIFTTSTQGASLTTIPVEVTLLNQMGDRILSDGPRPYVHGVDDVTAVIVNNTRNPNDPLNGKLDVRTGK